ncbi:MAG: UvrD-helicase domain-containing protein [Pseudanabaenaceae cyanobacterium]
MSTHFLNRLNLSQKKAAQHYEGPLLVVAGAGSGKTRTLTYRIANLLLHHQVLPENILAVTFTNKAAREMSDRLTNLLTEELCWQTYNRSLEDISELEHRQLVSKINRTYIKRFKPDGLWIGTFHSMCCRILRLDIDKYTNPQGRQWQKNFSIFDDNDSQTLVKDIVVNELKLDEKKFDPRSIRYAISRAKNTVLSPTELAHRDRGYRHEIIVQVYEKYQERLITSNALDFDDLIYVPVLLFRQQPAVLNYWHDRFQHILVDEYQDTNRTQYELIKLLTTNGQNQVEWHNRSIFVVGDADQSIYSFRAADFTILMEFQHTFGDGLPDEQTQSMIKLEENYRSQAKILHIANQLIRYNTQRIDKKLVPTKGEGELIQVYGADNELAEAEFVARQIRQLCRQTPTAHYGHFAILYRTNAQSRQFEEVLVRQNIPHQVIGGLRFYDRKEIKDILAYLRLLVNPYDELSLLRAIAVPKRGVGAATVDKLLDVAHQQAIPLWQLLQNETQVRQIAGRSGKGVLNFVALLQKWIALKTERSTVEIIQGLLYESGYVGELQAQGTDEALDRISNLQELCNAAVQFAEETGDPSLEVFLENAALASNLDEDSNDEQKVKLMTLHSAKGLEFPVVFLVGLEQGLFPSSRSLNDPLSLEEERRLMYVGITRAQEYLFLCHARERRYYGNRNYCEPSQFLYELPVEYLQSAVTQKKYQDSMTTKLKAQIQTQPDPWEVGDRIVHPQLGKGSVIRVMGNAPNITLAVRFDRTAGLLRWISPRTEKIRRLPAADE